MEVHDMNLTRLVLLALVFSGYSATLAMGWEVTHEGRHVAHVGGPIRITLSCDAVPHRRIESLKVFIDGKPLSDPEIDKSAAAATEPGGGKITFVYRPEKRGQHRVELLPVVTGSDSAVYVSPPRIFLFFVL
jgi:hypothetical protein